MNQYYSVLNILKILFELKNNENAFLVENSIHLQILGKELKINQHFSNLKV